MANPLRAAACSVLLLAATAVPGPAAPPKKPASQQRMIAQIMDEYEELVEKTQPLIEELDELGISYGGWRLDRDFRRKRQVLRGELKAAYQETNTLRDRYRYMQGSAQYLMAADVPDLAYEGTEFTLGAKVARSYLQENEFKKVHGFRNRLGEILKEDAQRFKEAEKLRRERRFKLCMGALTVLVLTMAGVLVWMLLPAAQTSPKCLKEK